MFRSLNTRLLLSYIAVILVCLALVGLGLLVFVRTSPIWSWLAVPRLEAVARATLPALRRAGPLEALTSGQFQALLTQAAEDQEVRILLLDEKGLVLFDTDRAWEGEHLEEAARSRVVQSRIQGVLTAPDDTRWAFFGQNMPVPGGDPDADPASDRYILLFVSSQRRALAGSRFTGNMLRPLLRAGAVALIVSVLLALLISRSVAAPLRRVAAAAEAIARGEIDTRAPVSGPTEVRAMARSFNAMADQVEAVQQSQRDFVANVSHELKTPLTSIQGFSQALVDGTASTPEAVSHAAGVIHEEAERMRHMVDELLILARFDAGQMVMARDRVELAPVLRGVVEKLTPQAQAADVALELNLAGPPTVTGDADRLAQIFTNLLDNALAHTPAGGRVTLTARPMEEGHAVEVTVTDTGEGIPAEVLPRIFERFYQVDKARRRSRGAGLGLAITKEIVEAHGGTVAAESVVGLGSRFTVRLPAREDKADDRG